MVKGSLYKKVGIASLIMMASVFLSRVIGLLREMMIAFAGGAGADVDAYQVAFIIPEMLNHIAASGFLSVTFIPVFSAYLVKQQEERGWEALSVILNCFGAGLIILIIASMVFARELVSFFAPGLTDPEVIRSAVRMTRIIMPAQFFFFAGGLFMAVQFAREKFSIPALAPLVYNLGIIAGGVFLAPYAGMEGFSWGVLGGAFAGNFLLQYYGASRAGMRLYPVINFRHRDLRKYFFLTLPLMLGLGMTFSTEFFFKFFGSFLPPGSIASLNYGLRIMLILVGLFGQAVGVASFPFMAGLAARGEIDRMNDLLNTTIKYLMLVIPFSVLFMVLRHEIVLLLFQRGKFDAGATAATSRVLVYLMTGAFAFAAQTVVVRGYYAMENTLFPALFGTVAVLISLPAYYLGMTLMGVRGVALTVSLSALFQVWLLFFIWSRRHNNTKASFLYGFALKIIVLSALMGLLLEQLRLFAAGFLAPETFTGCLLLSLAVSAAFILLLFLAAWGLKISELDEMAGRIAARIFKGKGRQ